MFEYLGNSEKAIVFADEFVRRKNFETGDGTTSVGGGGSSSAMAWSIAGNGEAGGKKKGRKQRGARVDSAMLGFVGVDRNDID